MPRSLTSLVEQLTSQQPAKDAPTRFDLYSLQKSIDDCRDSIEDLSAQIAKLTEAVNELSDATQQRV